VCRFHSPLEGPPRQSATFLAGIAVARALNIAPETLQDAVRHLAPRKKCAGERTERNGVVLIINDSYNANPDAMKSMLELLAGDACPPAYCCAGRNARAWP